MEEKHEENPKHSSEEAVRQFVEAQLRGEQPDLNRLIARYPDIEEQIRQKIESFQCVNSLFDALGYAQGMEFEGQDTKSDLLGQKLGKFEIEKVIGRGGMGVVYLAHDTKLDRSVAIKSIPDELADNEHARMRFQREAKTLASLNHPNIAVIYDMIERSVDSSLLVMEYVPGRTLAEYIKHKQLELDEALCFAQQIAEALSAAYEQGVIHRDVKPGNIKITPEDRVKVLDFGLAKSSTIAGAKADTAVTQPGRVIGTPAYMSPEQSRGKPADHRSDIWSFGCIMYEMLTGQPAFQGETALDIAAHILERDPDWAILPRHLPESVRNIIQRCLRKDPRKRFQSASDLAYALKEAQTESSRTTTAAQPRRIKVGPSVMTIAILAIIALVLYSIYHRGDQTVIQDTVDSLAVLPLENLSGDSNQTYFADGITDALITELGKISAFRKVMSYSSTARYRDQPKTLSEIAGELDVTGLIEGSVQREGQRVRIRTSLIHAPSGRIIWTDSYDRNAQDILTLQQEIARTVAEQLQIALTPQEEELLTGGRPVNTEAHDAYLRGTSHYRQFSAEGLAKARELYEEAISKDPHFVPAYSGMLDYYGAQAYWGYQSARDISPHMKRLLTKVMELDESRSVALKNVAKMRFYFDWEWEVAEQSYQAALNLNPNDPQLYFNYALLLTTLGKFVNAHEMLDQAVDRDPSGPWEGGRGYILAVEGRMADALVSLESRKHWPPSLTFLWNFYWLNGEYTKAFAACRDTLALRPGFEEALAALEQGWLQDGTEIRNRYVDAMRLAANALVNDRDAGIGYRAPRLIAKLFLHAGNREQALHYLESAHEEKDPKMVELVDPVWRNLHSEPRFLKIVEEMNIPTGFLQINPH